MNKITKIITFSFLSLILLFIILIVLEVTTGKGILFKKLSLDHNYEIKQVEYENDFNEIYINTFNRNIVFYQHNKDHITVEYYESKNDFFNVATDNSKLNINNDYTYKWSLFGIISSNIRTIKVYLPKDFNKNIEVITTNGNLKISDFNLNNVLFTSSNGEIYIKELNAADINAKTSNGKMYLENIEAKKVTANTINGNISIKETKVVNDIKTKTTNGNIDMFDLNAIQISASTTNGRINAKRINSEIVQLNTTNSKIVAYELTSNNISLHTVNGDIKTSIKGELENFKLDVHTSSYSEININGKKHDSGIINPDKINIISLTTVNGDINLNFYN